MNFLGYTAGYTEGRFGWIIKRTHFIFDPFIKFIIMLRIDTMISVVYCRLSGHNVDDRLPTHNAHLYSEIIRVYIRNRRMRRRASPTCKKREARCARVILGNAKKSIQKYHRLCGARSSGKLVESGRRRGTGWGREWLFKWRQLTPWHRWDTPRARKRKNAVQQSAVFFKSACTSSARLSVLLFPLLCYSLSIIAWTEAGGETWGRGLMGRKSEENRGDRGHGGGKGGKREKGVEREGYKYIIISYTTYP